MKYHELQTTNKKSLKRVGRGIAAGQGKTAGRGTKGQGSRTGSSRKPGFEGGSNPLMQRLPKLPGFKSKKTPAENVFTGDLDAFGVKVTTVELAEAGLISNPYVRVKLLVQGGDVKKKHDVKLQGASAAAVELLQKAGGSFEKVGREERPITRAPKEERKR
jgi:large subunit ribosomal protein L15